MGGPQLLLGLDSFYVALTTGVGSFNPATSASSVFACQAPRENFEILLTATNHQCSKSLVIAASCKAQDI